MARAKKLARAKVAAIPAPEPMPGVVRVCSAGSTNAHDHPLSPEAAVDARRILDRLPRYPWEARPDGVYDATGQYLADFGYGEDATARDAARLPELLRNALDEIEHLGDSYAGVRDEAHNEVADEARAEGRTEGFNDCAERLRAEAGEVFNDAKAEAEGIASRFRDDLGDLLAEYIVDGVSQLPAGFDDRVHALFNRALACMDDPLDNAMAGIDGINLKP